MYIYALDWLLNKPLKVEIQKEDKKDLEVGDRLLYREKGKVFAGTYLGYGCSTDKKGKYIAKLKGYSLKNFKKRNKKAQKYFDEVFEDLFPKFFPTAKPITAKMAYKTNIIYFYFYAEDRFDFREFLNVFKDKIDDNFFLYQVGARDRISLDPGADNLCGTCGKTLCCKRYKCTIPTIESDNIPLQNLSSRGVENLKGRCGKLKCCLNYERQVYQKEADRFPKKGEQFDFQGVQYMCKKFSIMTGDIIARSVEGGDVIKVNIQEIKTL